MPDSDVLADLADWLEPVGMTLTVDTLAARRLTVQAIADGGLSPHTLVAAAYGQLVDDAKEALSRTIRAADPSLVVTGKDALVCTLVAAAVIIRLADEKDSARAALALLVESATFLGLTPMIARLPGDGSRAAEDLGRRARGRLEPEATGQAIQRLLRDSEIEAQAVDGTPEALLKRMKSRDAALVAIGKRTEQLLTLMTERMQLLDEEVDTLWWSHTGRRIKTGESWATILPSEARAALAVADLALLLTRFPAPSSAASLLRRTLGDDADSPSTLQTFAEAVADSAPEERQNRLLAPISSLAARIRDVGDVTAAAAAFTRVYRIDGGHRFTLLEGAEQLLREHALRTFL